ncbi:MAG: Type 1 glutamine amidotransferase-like domain-containing protein [Candidatus Nanopelagicaceae bacterium]
MSGSLALVGSGEYLPAMADLERSLIEDGLKSGREAHFIQIPTAAGQESLERLKYWEELGRSQAEAIGVKQVFLPIFDRDAAMNQEYADLISQSALIYMSGGDPHYLAKSLVGTPVGRAIESSWQSGASLAGCSAGAMVMSSSIPQFRLSRSEPTRGLSLIPRVRVIPHFDKFFRWIPESAAQRMMQVPDEAVLLGIDELTALVRRQGEDLWQVHGKAEVHLLKGVPEGRFSHAERISLPI